MSDKYPAARAASTGAPRASSASARCAVPSNQTPVRSRAQKLTPLKPSTAPRPLPGPDPLTARLRTFQLTDDSYAGSRSARYDQLLTSSGISLSSGVTPSLVVPTLNRPWARFHIAATKRLAHAALADQAGWPVCPASVVKKA